MIPISYRCQSESPKSVTAEIVKTIFTDVYIKNNHSKDIPQIYLYWKVICFTKFISLNVI